MEVVGSHEPIQHGRVLSGWQPLLLAKAGLTVTKATFALWLAFEQWTAGSQQQAPSCGADIVLLAVTGLGEQCEPIDDSLERQQPS